MATAEHAEHGAHHDHDHHELPTAGRALSSLAVSATLHCLTGCAIGEVTGMVIGTALGFSEWGTVGLAVALAFLFGYSLTSLPLLRAGLALSAVVPIALASDTFSIATMEIIDNAVMLIVPGAMEAGLDSVLFWGALSFALAVAGVAAYPVNRWLLARGKGHAAVHRTGIHGGPSPRLVGAVAAVLAVFGAIVLVAEAFDGNAARHGGGHAAETETESAAGHGAADQVRGLAVSEGGLRLALERTTLPRGERSQLEFRVMGEDGKPVTDFEVEHEKRMHLILVRRDLTGFQHLHPTRAADGTWRTPVTLREAGSYRVYADFKHEGENRTLASDVSVDGPFRTRALPAPQPVARTSDGYSVRVAARDGTFRFTPTRGGRPVEVERYLGAGGHLVALREGDLAFLHVHPTRPTEPEFAVELPKGARYRLFLQFKDAGRVRTAAFTWDGSSLSGDAPEADRGHSERGGAAHGDDGH